MAVANFNDNTVSILLGKPGGGFTTQKTYAVGVSPSFVVAADFNGDGIIDLAVLNGNAPSVSVMLGNGDGTFQSRTDYTVGTTPTGIAIGDFDGDKKLDLAISDAGDSDVSILFGNGDGSFQSRIPVSVGPSPLGLAAADLNHDGVTDLATTNLGNATVTVLMGSSSRSFTTKTYASGIYPKANNSAIALADFDRDGELDALVLDGSEPASGGLGQLMFLKGDGNGGFKSPVSCVSFQNAMQGPLVVADLNHDGILDVAVYNSIALGNGDGTFRAPNSFPTGTPVAVLDLNRDGLADIVAVNTDYNSVEVSLGNGDGTFSSQSTLSFGSSTYGPGGSVTGDFNQDGKLDIAVLESGYPAGQILVRLGNGDGTFKTMVSSAAKYQGINNGGILLTGDFNGDGKPDILMMDDYYKGFTTLLGAGDGTFTVGTDTTTSYQLVSIAAGSLRGNGKADVVACCSTLNGQPFVNIYLNKGDGSFEPGGTLKVPYTGNVAIADVNKDGEADLVVASTQVFLGNGDGTFKAAINTPSINNPGAATIADFNGDGKPDILTPSYGGIAFLAGNGDGTFQAPVYSNTNYIFTSLMLTADFDGDGKLDIVTSAPANVIGNGAVAMLGNGDGTFAPPLAFNSPGTWPEKIVGDFNGDGLTDLALPSWMSQTKTIATTLYLSKTTSSFPSLAVSSHSLNFTSILGAGNPAAQILTVTNAGAGTLPWTASKTQSWLTISSTSGTAPSTITVSPSAAGLPAGTYSDTITVTGQDATGSPATVNVTFIVSPPPDFQLGAAPGGSLSATVNAGVAATYGLQLSPSNGFTGDVTLSCSGLPAGATCNTSHVAISASSATPFTLSITTTARNTASLEVPSSLPRRRGASSLFLLFAGLLLGAVLSARRNANRKLALMLILAATLLGIASCGSSGGSSTQTSPPTPAGAYTVTLTAKSGSLSHNVTLTLNVN